MKTAIAILILALMGGAALVVAGGAAMAQSLVPQSATARYSMQPVEGGVARLDTQTGEISLCQVEGGQLSCQTSEEDRARLEERIRELSDEVATLKDGDAPMAEPKTPFSDSVLPDDAELNKALGKMKHIFRAFRDIAKELDEDPAAPETGLAPHRT